MRNIARIILAVMLAGSLGLATAGAAAAQGSVTVSEFRAPVTSSGATGPYGITRGPDGNLWFTGWNNSTIGRITPSGVVKTFRLPSGGSPFGIASGPDGNLWFTESTGNKIGRITPTGKITEFPIPTASSDPTGITLGSDGNLWFTEELGNQIGRITPAGVITEFPLPTGSTGPFNITSDAAGNLWFTLGGNSQIGRITTSGTITEFQIPNVGGNYGPFGPEAIGIAGTADGNVWFTEFYGSYVGEINPQGVITQSPLPSTLSGPNDIAAGPDGNLYFTTNNTTNRHSRIGQITASGLNDIIVPVNGGEEIGITSGPDGNVWFGHYGANRVGRVNLTATAATSVALATSANPATEGQPVTYTATVSGLSGTLPPSGETVTFYDSGTPITGCTGVELTTTAPYTAACTVTYTNTKTHTIAAGYNGDSTYVASSNYPLLHEKVQS